MSVGSSNFEALLAGVLSHDNAVRMNAESVYARELETQPAAVVGELLRCLGSGQVNLPRHCTSQPLASVVCVQLHVYCCNLFRPGLL